MYGDDARHLWLSKRSPRGHSVCLAGICHCARLARQCAWCDRSPAGGSAWENCACMRHQEKARAMRWMPGVVWIGVLLWMGLGMRAVADPGPYEQRLTQ